LSVILGTKLPTAIPISAPGAGLAHGPLRIDSGKFPGIQEGMGLSAIILDILPKFVIIKIILQEERNERINMEIPSFQPTHSEGRSIHSLPAGESGGKACPSKMPGAPDRVPWPFCKESRFSPG
jgi:hypothetical protein